MAELKNMINNFVEVLKKFFEVLQSFINEITAEDPMPWEDEKWA